MLNYYGDHTGVVRAGFNVHNLPQRRFPTMNSQQSTTSPRYLETSCALSGLRLMVTSRLERG